MLKVFEDNPSLAEAAAQQASAAFRGATSEQGRARIIAATAASQIGSRPVAKESRGHGTPLGKVISCW